jgi:hypothetical protein
MPHPRSGFRVQVVYKHKQHHPLKYASQKFSFWIATLSMFAFVVGNMVGQHGWYAFWKSVLGKVDDSIIVFTGTVTPLEKIPDFTKWSAYGGGSDEHTFREVPQDLLISMPSYSATVQKDGSTPFYSVGYMGSYDEGGDGDGSHPGVDIRTPIGTPVRSIANGIVETVRDINGGYGKYIVIRHPNVPDQASTKKKRTVWSVYAHLSDMLVSEGQVIEKGQQIGLSGMSGDASGPHLHFQIDNDLAPWHPYWPFTSDEMRTAHLSLNQAINTGFHSERGYEYTVSPLLFVQSYETSVPSRTVASDATGTTDQLTERPLTTKERIEARRTKRSAQYATTVPRVTVAATDSSQPIAPVVTPPLDDVQPSASTSSVSLVQAGSDVDHITISHDGFYRRSWEKFTVTAYDKDGDVVRNPSFAGKIYFRAAFGEAEFRPAQLTAADFVSRTATVNVLPHEAKRSFIMEAVGAFQALSQTMVMER